MEVREGKELAWVTEKTYTKLSEKIYWKLATQSPGILLEAAWGGERGEHKKYKPWCLASQEEESAKTNIYQELIAFLHFENLFYYLCNSSLRKPRLTGVNGSQNLNSFFFFFKTPKSLLSFQWKDGLLGNLGPYVHNYLLNFNGLI